MKHIKILPVVLLTLSGLVGCSNSQGSGPHFSDDDYGYLLNTFYGPNSKIEVDAKVTTYTEGDSVIKLTPKKIAIEEHSYTYEDPIAGEEIEVKENVLVVYYKTYKKNDYRLTLTSAEIKRVVLEIKENDEYVDYKYFIPEAPEFAGAYNGYSDVQFGDSNVVYIVDNDLNVIDDEKYAGYKVDGYLNQNFGESSYLLVPGYYFYENYIFKVADFYDTSDGEFMEYVLLASDDGALDQVISGQIYSSFFADPTFFFSTIYDEDGTKYNNYYETEYDEEYSQIGNKWYFNGEEVNVTPSRDEYGQKFTLNYVGRNTTNYLEVRSIRNEYYVSFFGESSLVEHSYANVHTMLTLGEYEQRNYVTSDLVNKFTYYIDMDDDWNDVLISKFNNRDVTVGFKANTNGRVIAYFTDPKTSNKIEIEPINGNYGLININGIVQDLFSKEVAKESLSYTFLNPNTGLKFAVDSEFGVALNGAAKVQGTLIYDKLFGIGLSIGEYKVFHIDADHNFFFVQDEEELLTFYFNESLFKNTVGSYTDGTNNFEFSSDYALTANGTKIDYVADIIMLDAPYLCFRLDGYVVIPNQQGVLNLYSVVGKTISFVRSAVSSDVYLTFLGNYRHQGEYGVEELNFDGTKVQLSTLVGEELVLKEYDFLFGNDELGNFTLNPIVTQGGSTFTVPFIKMDHAYVLDMGPNSIYYLEEPLFAVQGFYGDETNVALVKENIIIFGNNRLNIESINDYRDATGGKVVIVCEDGYELEFNFNSTGAYELNLKHSGEVINLTKKDVNSRLFNFEKEKFVLDENNSYSAFVYYSSVLNNTNFQVLQNGQFFTNTLYPEYVDGEIVLHVKAFFGEYRLSFDASGNPVATKL